MKFNSPYEREKQPVEAGGGERIVETAGYVPIEAQIAQFINAGKRLEDYRSQYDFGNGQPVPEDFIDPTKKKDFDIIDAQNLVDEVNEKVSLLQKTKKIPKEKVETEEVKK